MVNSVNLLSHAILKYLLSVWLLFNDGFEVANTAQYTVHFKICYKIIRNLGYILTCREMSFALMVLLVPRSHTLLRLQYQPICANSLVMSQAMTQYTQLC